MSELERTIRKLDGDLHMGIERLAMPAGVVDTSGTIVYLNAAAMKRVGDVRGQPAELLFAPESRELARERFARKLSGSESATEFGAKILIKDGVEVSAEVCSVALERDGHVVGVFGLINPVEVRRSPKATGPNAATLTRRQTEVLEYLAQGLTTEQIAETMGIALHTVRNHVRDLLARLRAHSRLEAVVRGQELGLI